LLDTSDDLPEPAKREIKTYIIDIAGALPVKGLLDIRLLDPAVRGGRRDFERCNPGDGSDLDNLTGNPELAKKRWRETFRQPLDEAIDAGIRPISTQTSPILETLQAIALDRFTGQSVANLPKTLIVVSDLIEHGPDYSQYRGDLSYDKFRASLAYRKVRTDLHGASVRLFYVQRLIARPLNSGAHIQFWIDWIQDNNGRFVDAKKLQGVR